MRDSLPIDGVLPELLTRLREAGAVVLQAPTGAGKTTRVPPAILGQNETQAGRIVMLEPRRVAARSAARRMACEDETPLGERFGYHVRFDRRFGPRTRVLVMTPGILLRLLHDDPYLETVDTIVFDEFHERGLETDLAFGMVRLIRQTIRPELRVVVMSATLDPEPLSASLGGCPVVVSPGRLFPVEIRYRPRRADVPWPDAAAAAVRDVLSETVGDVLVFLPGLREIRRTQELLTDLMEHGVAIWPLHGDLSPEQQDRALQRHPTRKVVLATNVAETSVTVEGITAVVDTGLARQMEYDASVGLDRLRLVPISRASADQRAGRAGRTRPGVCVRLWDESGHRGRAEQTQPELVRVDLSSAVLQLYALGETDCAAFPWFETPPVDALERARSQLTLLGAMRDGDLTPTGHELALLPVPPRLGRMLLEGQILGHPERVALAAALLAERDPFARDTGSDVPIRIAAATRSDVLDRVEALEQYEQTGRLESPIGRLHRGSVLQLLRTRDQLLWSLSDHHTAAAHPVDPDEALLRSVFVAFSDRLARRRSPGDSRGKMVGGRGVRLAPGCGVRDADLFVCVDVDAGGVDAFVRLASAVRREWLPNDRIVQEIEMLFDETQEKVIARKITRFEDLVLDESIASIPDDSTTAAILAEAALERCSQVLPEVDSEAGQFRTRVRCLRDWMPELDLPAFDSGHLRELLPGFCLGNRSFAELRNGAWLDLFRGALTYPQLQILEREAPAQIIVPSGSSITLTYEEGRPPILAARIQELFGLNETPRLAGGRVKVLLHLLAPNYRPQQVTDDLASFWKNGYPVIRKELRGRYPKHSWPEDPFTAEAIRGPKRRPG